jgi:plasmid stabilization system protein ParE
METVRVYLDERNPQASARVLDALRLAFERLTGRPHLGRVGDERGTREWSGIKYPYVIVYRVSRKRRAVEIAGVFHTAQGERKLWWCPNLTAYIPPLR